MGRLFGQMFAEIERWNLGIAEQVNRPAEPLVIEYRDGRPMWNAITGKDADDGGGERFGTNDAERRYRQRVEQLLSHRCVQLCPHAEMILRADHTLCVSSGNLLCAEVSEFSESKATASLALERSWEPCANAMRKHMPEMPLLQLHECSCLGRKHRRSEFVGRYLLSSNFSTKEQGLTCSPSMLLLFQRILSRDW